MSLKGTSKNNVPANWSARRLLTVLSLVTAMLFLLWFGKTHNPAITLQMCLADPQAFDKTLIEIGAEVTVARVTRDGFTIRQMGVEVPVRGTNHGIKPGEFIYLLAVFHQPGWLELKRFHIAKYRRAKIAVSILPIPLIAFLFLKKYRFSWRRFEFMERS